MTRAAAMCLAALNAAALCCCRTPGPGTTELARAPQSEQRSAPASEPLGDPDSSASTSPASPAPPQPATARLIVVVQRVDSSDGSLVVGLCGARERWLATDGYDFGTVHPLDTTGSAEVAVSLENVPVGRWALSVFHDRDQNGELNRGPFRIPAEPWGFGNDPPALGGARFDDALIEVTVPETRVVVTLRGGITATDRDTTRPSSSPRRQPTDAP